jgi:hypothetical protein
MQRNAENGKNAANGLDKPENALIILSQASKPPSFSDRPPDRRRTSAHLNRRASRAEPPSPSDASPPRRASGGLNRLTPLAFALFTFFAASPAFGNCTYTNATSGTVSGVTRYGDSVSAACTDSSASSSNNALVVIAPSTTFSSSNFYGALGLSSSDNVTYNTVNFNGSIDSSNIYGGRGNGRYGNAINNTVIFNGSIGNSNNSNHPPAKPGAFVCEPLKAARPERFRAPVSCAT